MIYFILAVIALNLWFAHRKGLIEFNGCYEKHPILTKVITFCIFFFGTLVVLK